eukprot:6173518-Pleurochrysis_carterae.AAC.1
MPTNFCLRSGFQDHCQLTVLSQSSPERGEHSREESLGSKLAPIRLQRIRWDSVGAHSALRVSTKTARVRAQIFKNTCFIKGMFNSSLEVRQPAATLHARLDFSVPCTQQGVLSPTKHSTYTALRPSLRHFKASSKLLSCIGGAEREKRADHERSPSGAHKLSPARNRRARV